MNSPSEEKIICPWCGAEMRASVAMLDVYGAIARYECSFCHACGPQRRGLQKEETSAAARAAAMRRYMPTSTAENKLVCPINGAPCSECKPGSPCAVEAKK